MLARLLLLFIVLPMVELALLLAIARQTSLMFTIGLILFTGFVGAWLARKQGSQCFRRIQAEMSQGRIPSDSLIDGLMILVAGILLITPGVLTDLVGFSLLIPKIRVAVRRRVLAWLKPRIVVSRFSTGSPFDSNSHDVIDVEHRSVDPPEGG